MENVCFYLNATNQYFFIYIYISNGICLDCHAVSKSGKQPMLCCKNTFKPFNELLVLWSSGVGHTCRLYNWQRVILYRNWKTVCPERVSNAEASRKLQLCKCNDQLGCDDLAHLSVDHGMDVAVASVPLRFASVFWCECGGTPFSLAHYSSQFIGQIFDLFVSTKFD